MTAENIKKYIDKSINPILRRDGIYIIFVRLENEKTAVVQIRGTVIPEEAKQLLLTLGIERTLQKRFPDCVVREGN